MKAAESVFNIDRRKELPGVESMLSDNGLRHPSKYKNRFSWLYTYQWSTWESHRSVLRLMALVTLPPQRCCGIRARQQDFKAARRWGTNVPSFFIRSGSDVVFLQPVALAVKHECGRLSHP
jgi:hypothetical protein